MTWEFASGARDYLARSWGGWGSNPRPADYEKPGPAVRVRYLHRYHEVLPPMAQIAPLARVTRSTSRSTPEHGGRILATERYPRRSRLEAWHGLFCCGRERRRAGMTAEYPQGDEPLIPMPALSLP